MIQYLASKLPDYTYSIPGFFFYFFDFTHTKLGFKLREKLFFNANDLVVDLKGKRCMIAGGNAGIGRAAAQGLAGLGATVHILCRSKEKGEKAVQEIKSATGNPEIHLHVVDLSSLHQIDSFTESFAASKKPLHVLINNAATMQGERTVTSEGIESALATNLLGFGERTVTSEGIETALATNLLGFVGLTKGLLPIIEQEGRIINVVSAGMLAMKFKINSLKHEATLPYDGAAAYSLHHRARVMLTELWAKELKEDKIAVNSVHPGWVDTPLLSSAKPMEAFYKLTKSYLRTEAEGADTIIWLAASKKAGQYTGKYFFDRKPRWTNLLFAHTASEPEDYRALIDFVEKAL